MPEDATAHPPGTCSWKIDITIGLVGSSATAPMKSEISLAHYGGIVRKTAKQIARMEYPPIRIVLRDSRFITQGTT